MMIFLAVAVIGVIMAVKNRIANNRLANLVKDGKLQDRLDDIKRLQKRPTRKEQDLADLPDPKWDNTTIDLGKAKAEVWGKKGEQYKKSEESIEKLIDKLKDDDEDKEKDG